jgi:glucokinase
VAQVLGNVDIGASKVLVGVSSMMGELHEESVASFVTPATPEELLRLITSGLRGAARSDSIERIGCVAPGPIDYVNGVISRMHNKSWAPIPVVAGLQRSFACEVRLEDDAAGAALAEALVGAGAGHDPVAYITVSSGIGAGLVVNGELYRGAHGTAGEIGHIVIDPTGPLCNCGRYGDVESYAGGMSLLRQIVAQWPDPGKYGSSDRSPAELFLRAAAGDERALEMHEHGRNALARCFAAIAALWDPEVIVVGGSVALGQPQWIEESIELARELCMAEVGTEIAFELATLGKMSALIGAGLLAAKPSSAGERSLRLDTQEKLLNKLGATGV